MNNTLPYMAMMRNLRNILSAEVPDFVHQKVCQKICDPKAVENAKMFPLQYFSALNEIEIALEKGIQIKQKNTLLNLLESAKKVPTKEELEKQLMLEEEEKTNIVKIDPMVGKAYQNAIQ